MRTRWLLGLFTHDIKNKAFALFFAVTIWYFAWNNQVANSGRGEVRLDVKPEPGRVGGSAYELVRVSPVRKEDGDVAYSGFVTMVLSGPQRDLRELDWENIGGLVKIHPGDWEEAGELGVLAGEVRLTSAHFRLPSRSLSIVEGSISPSVLYYNLSEIVTREVKIVADKPTGTPPLSYRVSTSRGREVKPPTVRVRGPEFFFASLQAFAGAVDLTDMAPEELSLTKRVPVRLELTTGQPIPRKKVYLVDGTGNLLDTDTNEVEVTVYLEHEKQSEFTAEVKLWAQVPLEGIQQKAVAVKCNPPRLWVRFVGPDELIKKVEENYKNYKNEPTFGLYFVVGADQKFGEPISKTLTDLKWDAKLIPPGVSIEFAEDPTGHVSKTENMTVTLHEGPPLAD